MLGSLIIGVVLTLLSSWIISKASDGFETASNFLGRNMSEGMKGATINAIGSSMPELWVTFIYLFLYNDTTGFAGGIGTTAGSAVFNAIVIPAFVIISVLRVSKHTHIKVSKTVILRDGLTLIGAEIFLIYFLGVELKWFHGLFLMIIYIGYISWMIYRQNKKQKLILKNIRRLLTDQFTDGELRRLCYDDDDFRPVYNQFSKEMGKNKIIDELIEYAQQEKLIKSLLVLAKEYNPKKFKNYQLSDNLTASPTISSSIHEKTQRVNRTNDEASGEDDDADDEAEKDEQERGSRVLSFFKLNLKYAVLGENELRLSNGLLLLFVSTAFIVAASWALVYSCETIGEALGLHGYFVAVIVAAAASSVPDTILSIRDAKNGKYDDAVANALGSNIFDICFALGAPLFLYTVFVGPIMIGPETNTHIIELRLLLLFLTVITFFILLFSSRLTKITATTFIFMYLFFVIYIFGRAYEQSYTDGLSRGLQYIQGIIQ